MKTTAELEARIAELEAAVEWTLQQVTDLRYFREIQDELRARAFPPKFETVDVVRWIVISNHDGSETRFYCEWEE